MFTQSEYNTIIDRLMADHTARLAAAKAAMASPGKLQGRASDTAAQAVQVRGEIQASAYSHAQYRAGCSTYPPRAWNTLPGLERLESEARQYAAQAAEARIVAASPEAQEEFAAALAAYNERAAWVDATLPSHAACARKRSSREKGKLVVDELASREPGWILVEQAKRRATREAVAWAKTSARYFRKHNPTRDAFLAAYEQAGFRQAKVSAWVDGTGHDTTVNLCDEPTMTVGKRHDARPTALSSAETVWAGNGKCRSGVASKHDFWIRTSWVQDVLKNDLTLIDGCLTLDAKEVPEARRYGYEAHLATWVRQGRGTSLVVECGAIVRLSPASPWVHGTTVGSALSTARRRASSEALATVRADRQAARDAAIARADWSTVWPRVDLATVQVCLRDSLAVGNCESGSRAWVAKWMPDWEGDCAPASAVLAAASQDDTSTRRLAVAAVHRAVLRSRKQAA